MKFLELLKKYKINEIEDKIKELFPDQIECLKNGSYANMINKLYGITPIETDYSIIIEKIETIFEKCIDVSAKNKAYEDDGVKWAIELTPWEEWLSMEVEEKTLNEFSELEIIAYCLGEMSFLGFNQSNVEKKISEIINKSDELIVGEIRDKDELREIFEIFKGDNK